MKNIFKTLLVSMLLIACTQEGIVLETDTIAVNKKTEDSSMLSFESKEAFNEFIAYTNESEVDLLEKARTVFDTEGRLSLLLIYNDIETEVAENLGLIRGEIPVVNSSDSTLLFLLNEKGEVRISDTIYRIDGEFVYGYKIDFEHEINEFTEAYNANDVKVETGIPTAFGKGLTIYKHTNNIQEEAEELKQAKVLREFDNFNGNKARMISKQWTESWFFYGSIGSLTKVQTWSQTLWWHAWKDAKTDNRLEYNVAYTIRNTFNGQTNTAGANGHVYCNCNEAKKIYRDSGGAFADEYIPTDGWTKHWAHWYPATPNTVGRTIFY